uniref:Uncharacterized protein n=1 Tax=Aegilops tauschii subsp. strangulata TaxID=200361 RepID=A0A453FHD2_AEGTS
SRHKPTTFQASTCFPPPRSTPSAAGARRLAVAVRAVAGGVRSAAAMRARFLPLLARQWQHRASGSSGARRGCCGRHQCGETRRGLAAAAAAARWWHVGRRGFVASVEAGAKGEMESTMKEIRGGGAPCVLDMDDAATVGGGVEDTYGEDRATEEQLVTPWTVSVASGYNLLRDPRYNKGLAFTEKERETHYLRGLLPPAVTSQELQERKIMHNIRQYQLPLQRYMAMMDLQVTVHYIFLSFHSVADVRNLLWLHCCFNPYCRRGMRGFSTSSSLTMLRSCFLLCTLQLLVRPAKSTGLYLVVRRVFTSA